MEVISKTYLSLFHCIVWENVAENTKEYCKKGDIVGIKGRLQSRVVEQEDKRQTVMEVIGEKVTFLSSAKEREKEEKSKEEKPKERGEGDIEKEE